VVFVACATVLAVLILAAGARAATITVTTTADDNVPNDGSVSLREAIQAINNGTAGADTDISNQNPGTFGVNDTIDFNISASHARQTILVGNTGNGALPALTRPMTINGYSEPGASQNALANADNAVVEIALDGANAGPNADGILVGPTGGRSTIEGLDIFDFSLNQIELQGGGDTIAGDQVGFDNTGSPTHSPQGVRISNSDSSLVGGLTPGARNVISGNLGSAVDIAGTTGSPATGNFVEGNFIGTDPTGVAADGNGRAAPFVQLGAVQVSGGNGNTIGGSLAEARNVISGNGAGVDVRDGGQDNLVAGNFIGVGADGVTPVPNLNFGVRVASSDNLAPPLGPGQANEPASSGNIIGLNPNNSFTGAGNLIEFNGGDGVVIDETYLPNNPTPIANSGNSIDGNSIFSNGGLGIDLKGGAGNILPDNLMSAPTVTAANPAASATVVDGTLRRAASPKMTVRVEVFASARCDPRGSGEGQTLVGSADTTTDGSGNASFTANVSPLSPGEIVTATATNTTADASAQPGSVNVFDTSQYSTCFTVPARPTSTTVTCVPTSVVVARLTTCTATVSDTAPGKATTPGGSVSFSTDSPGTFSPEGLCTLSAGSCQVAYTPAAVGSGTHAITARYGGDAAHATSSGSAQENVNTPPPTPPAVTNPTESHARWREGNRLAGFSRKRALPIGTTFSFTLNEEARVSFTFTRSLPGRKVNGRCVAQTKRNRHKPACERAAAAGAIVFTGHPGLNKVAFQGRLSSSKRLKPGSYTLTITATNTAGQSTKSHTLSFTIVK
jgi:CSLREA domain-containing protein